MRRAHHAMIRRLMRLRFGALDEAIAAICTRTLIEYFDAAIPTEKTVTEITERLATLIVMVCPDAVANTGATTRSIGSCIDICVGVLGIRGTNMRRKCNAAIFRTMLIKYIDIERNARADLTADARTLRDLKDRYEEWSRAEPGVLGERRFYTWIRDHRGGTATGGNPRGTPRGWKQVTGGAGSSRGASRECSVCWESTVFILPCEHPICPTCDIKLTAFGHKRCPICRKQFKL